jgi:hypothetical protein
MQTDPGRRRRTRANTASPKPLWAASGDLVDQARPQSRVVIRGGTIFCGRSPFPGPPFCLGNYMIGRATRPVSLHAL